MRLRFGVAPNVDIEQSGPVRPAAIQVVQPVDGNERFPRSRPFASVISKDRSGSDSAVSSRPRQIGRAIADISR
jgi:hypothetical protein